MNGSRVDDQNTKARLAAQFNEFYLQVTSPDFKQIGNYKIIKEIGEGAFGKVYLANHILLNVQVVLKCGLIDDPNIVREVYYHRQLKHKNIVKLYEVIRSENHLWMALEYCEGSELFYYIYERRRLEYHECQTLFYQILTGVKYVHSLNLSHRDLKLENILLGDAKKSVIKLTDFGFVREFNPIKRQFLSTVCGTTVYMAPELIKNETYSGFAIDIWSLGVILFTMLYGEMPFDEDDDLKTKYKIVNEEPLYKESVPLDAVEIVKKMLSKDPRSRPGINDIFNSSFLIDISNKFAEKSNRSSFPNDQESILSISQHYNSGIQPFQSKMDRNLIRKFEKLNIDTTQLQQDVINGETNSLTAFYDLALVREFNKKKRHYREKKRKYKEAKKSLLNSRKRVKSALSLSEQGSNSQPLERIISSLSLSSNRNSLSRTNLSKVGSRKSIEFNEPFTKHRGSELNRNSLSEHRMNKLTPHLENSYFSSPGVDGANSNVGASLAKTVSFNPEDAKRRHSNATTTLSSMTGSESLKKKSKNTNIISKLQFWKKNKNSGADSARANIFKFDESQHISGLPFNNTYSPSPKTLVNGEIKRNIPVIETQDTTLANENPIPNIDKENKIGTNVDDLDVGTPNHQGTPNLEKFPSTSKYLRTRPSSVISQVSQISHLSQLSTMMSESDILVETDTMDEEEYDEDGLYESSFDNSQQDFPQRHSSLMTPNSGSSAANIKPSGAKKRPSYRRALSSDVSIMSTSTNATSSNPAQVKSQHQKKSLSKLSSNSSDESSANIKNINEQLTVSPKPTVPANFVSNDYMSNALSPTSSPGSPEPTQRRNKRPLLNSKIWQNSRCSQNPIPQANKVNSLPQSYQLLANHEPVSRSHSPPLPNKFNKLKTKNGSNTGLAGRVYNSKFLPKTTWPSKASQQDNHDIYTANMNNQMEENSQWNRATNPDKISTNGGNMYKTYFIIDEEEEDEH